MKKKNIALPFTLGMMLLSSCSGGGSKGYHIVDFCYNLADNDGVYLSVVVSEGNVLDVPADPEAEDHVFLSWYTDRDCSKEYKRWGLEIDKDFTLYAKWEDYEDASLDVKIGKFQEKLASFGKDACQVNWECSAKVGYPGAGVSTVFTAHDEYVYNRYKENITTRDYYQYEEDGVTLDYYGQEQFYTDGSLFYDIYHEFDDATQNTCESSSYKEEELNGLLSIDFQNLYKACENEILYYSGSSSYTSDTFEYAFTGNFTKLNASLTEYTYQEAYYVADYSDSLGSWVAQQYEYTIGLALTDGWITAANVEMSYILYVGEDVYYYVFENDTYDFFYNGGEFASFTGTRFTPE